MSAGRQFQVDGAATEKKKKKKTLQLRMWQRTFDHKSAADRKAISVL